MVVDGFVAGIDMQGHLGALDVYRPTVAVVADCPFWPGTFDYYMQHLREYEDILTTQGCFVSAFDSHQPDEDADTEERFLQRNTITTAQSIL